MHYQGPHSNAYNIVLNLNLFSQSYGIHITLLVINNLRGGHTHTHIHTYTNIHTHKLTHTNGQSHFKKPGTSQPAAGVSQI